MEDVSLKDVMEIEGQFIAIVKGETMDYSSTINCNDGSYLCTCPHFLCTKRVCKHLKTLMEYLRTFYGEEYNDFLIQFEPCNKSILSLSWRR